MRYTKLSGSKCHFCLKYNRGCMMCACACAFSCVYVCVNFNAKQCSPAPASAVDLPWVHAHICPFGFTFILSTIAIIISSWPHSCTHSPSNQAPPLVDSLQLPLASSTTGANRHYTTDHCHPSYFLFHSYTHISPPTRPLLWLTPSSFLYLPQQHLNNRSKSSLHHRSLPPFLLYVSFLHTRSPTNQAPQPVDPGSKAPRRQKQTRYWRTASPATTTPPATVVEWAKAAASPGGRCGGLLGRIAWLDCLEDCRVVQQNWSVYVLLVTLYVLLVTVYVLLFTVYVLLITVYLLNFK